MATNYLHRVLLIIPAARINGINAYIKAQVDPAGGDWFTANLSASGSAPATHAWCNAALTDVMGRKLLLRLVQQASIPEPADWDTKTRQQKKQWLLDQRATVRSRTGVWVVPMHNDDVWDDPAEALTVMGLQTIRSDRV